MAIESNEYAGLRRQFEIGLRLAPTRACAPSVAKALAATLDSVPEVSVRLVDMASEGTRVHITLAVCLGTIDAVKTADTPSRLAVTLLQRIVDEFAAYDPAFVCLPGSALAPAAVAARARQLATVG